MILQVGRQKIAVHSVTTIAIFLTNLHGRCLLVPVEQFDFLEVFEPCFQNLVTEWTATPKAMADGEVLATGRYRFRFCSTAQIPHGWDAGLLFEETQKTLLCSDLFHQAGDVEPLTESDVSDRVRAALSRMQGGPLANYIPYNARTEVIIGRLADLKPKTLAIMHGSSFTGDGERALRDLAAVMRETLGDPMSCDPPRR